MKKKLTPVLALILVALSVFFGMPGGEEPIATTPAAIQETVLTETQEVIDGVFTEEVKADLWDSVKSFFATLWDAIVDFVKGKAEKSS